MRATRITLAPVAVTQATPTAVPTGPAVVASTLVVAGASLWNDDTNPGGTVPYATNDVGRTVVARN